MESYRQLKAVSTSLWCAFGLVSCLAGCGESGQGEVQADASIVQPGVDPFCSTRPRYDFCEDFDTQDLPGVFDEHSADKAVMDINDGDASSLPRSLEISVEADGRGVLTHQFGPGGKLRLFGMLYLAALGEGDVKIGAFGLDDYEVGFGVSSDGTLWVYEGENRIEGLGTIPIDRWASFRWDVNLYPDGTGSASLRFGSDFIVETDALSPPAETDSSPTATVGLMDATGHWNVRFDNLTVTVADVTQ